MCCAAATLLLLGPRAFIIIWWIYNPGCWDRAFSTALWPILGFIFLPTTFVWYTAVQHWWHGVWSLWPVVGLVIALMIDVSPAKGRRRRKPRPEE